jgi:RNA polymerase sigma factor (TIGR02999 family)
MSDATELLGAMGDGDRRLSDELLPSVYDELRRLAARRLADERPNHTMSATSLVHEAWLRLVGGDQAQRWNSRGHFFGAAAEAMRRILVDQARRKAALKRGGEQERVPLDDAALTAARPEEVIAVHDALDALELEDPVTADLVKLHYFSGFSLEEASELLGVSRATAYRLWTFARAWLRAALREDEVERK